MFKYSITAYVEDKKGYYLNPEQVTPYHCLRKKC